LDTPICPVPEALDGRTILAICIDGDGFGVLEADVDTKEATYRTVSREGPWQMSVRPDGGDIYT